MVIGTFMKLHVYVCVGICMHMVSEFDKKIFKWLQSKIDQEIIGRHICITKNEHWLGRSNSSNLKFNIKFL